ncbi:MAG: Gfo/Idh/MocA family oxidoreductase [Kiritimatiellales bacterium]|nr:Gfo/Idh/MocA family oxidoreductase [Kiritimatiellales bacterium]
MHNASMAVLAAGGYSATAKGYAKNETISLGVIGTGGRMRKTLMQALKEIPGVQVNGVCDVYDDFRRSAHVMVGGRERKVFETADHRALLDRKDIDAVMIATPDHWHTPITIDACEAGKDVYCEKPLTHKLEEGPRVIEAVRRTKRVVQVGAQQRTMPHLVELRRRIKTGEIDLGPVHRVHMQWNRNHTPYSKPNYRIKPEQVDWQRFLGNAPQQPFDPFRMRNWRWMWDFGNGPLSDLMVHWLDATNWLLDLPMPRRIASIGGNYTTAGTWETPDTIITTSEYPDRQLLADFECTFSNNHEDGSMRIMGERATVYIDRARFEITPQHPQRKSKSKAESKMESMVVSEGKRGQGNYAGYNAAALHIAEWLQAARERRDPSDYVETAVQACNVCHYGNASYREKRMIEIG